MNWIRYGPHALLLRFAERLGDKAFARGRAIAAELERHPPPGLVEFVPAFTSVLLEFDPRQVPDVDSLVADLTARLKPGATVKLPAPPLHKIPVRYDGPDLERVAQTHRLSVARCVNSMRRPSIKFICSASRPAFLIWAV